MKYFFTLIDDSTRWTWIFILRGKSDEAELLKSLMSMVATQFDKKIKMFK